MKNLILLFLFLFICSKSFSQDLIVTQKGDSINCSIQKENKDFVYYSYYDKHNILKNSLLIREKISSIHKDFYLRNKEDYRSNGYSTNSNNYTKNINYHQFRIGIYGGLSYLLSPINDQLDKDFEKHYKELKSGIHLGVNAEFYFNEYLGIGAKFCRFLTENQSLVDIYMGQNIQTVQLREDIYTTFIGPSFSARMYTAANNKNNFHANISLGLVSYTDNVSYIYDYQINTTTIGIITEYGYDIAISNNFSLGAMVSIMLSNFNEFEITDGVNTQQITLPEGEYEGLNRIDFGLVLRFNK